MDIETIIKLVNAGFSADEIKGLGAMKIEAVKHETISEPALDPKPEVKEEPKKVPEEPKAEPDPIDQAMAAAQKKMDSFNTVMDSMIEKMAKMAGMPAIGSVQPKGIEDIISEFFKEEK